MEGHLLELLAVETEEEKRLLGGDGIDKRIYFSGQSPVVSQAKLQDYNQGISVRTHTRYTDFPPHKHNYVEMMIVLSGSITHKLIDKTVTVGEGEMLIMNRHVCHSICRAEASDIGVNIIMSDEFLDTLTHDIGGTVFAPLFSEHRKEDGEAMYLYFTSGGERRIENLVENLLFELTSDSPERGLMARTVALLLGYLSKNRELLLDGTAPRDKTTDRALAITRYIKDNYRTATLSELCERLYLTPPYLSKLINEYFGKSFKELLLEERLERAKELFVGTDMAVGQVVRAVGYENESYFHRRFRERFGVSPLNMRRQEKRKIAKASLR